MEVKFSGLVGALDLELCEKILEKDFSPGQAVFLFFLSHLVY